MQEINILKQKNLKQKSQEKVLKLLSQKLNNLSRQETVLNWFNNYHLKALFQML